MNILVIRFSSLGDVVLATGALRALGLAIPGAHQTFLTKPEYLPLLKNLDVTVRAPLLHSRHLISSAHQAIKGQRFDCIIDLHASVRSIALSGVLPARHRIRVKKYTAQRKAMVKHKRGLDHPLSVLNAYRDAIQLLEPSVSDIHPRLFLSGGEAAQARSLQKSAPNCLGIGWGARWASKAVPARTWQALLAQSDSRNCDSLRIFGLETDRPAIEAFLAENDSGKKAAHVECGHSIRAAMTRLAACNAFIGSDSGLMHIAAALGVPTIGLFGPTHPALGFAPAGDDSTCFHAGTYCSPCHRHGAAPCFRGHRFCFDELNIASIAESVRNALAKPWSLPHVAATT